MAASQSTYPVTLLTSSAPQLASPPVTPVGSLDEGPLLRPEFPTDDVLCLPFVRNCTDADGKPGRSFWSCPPRADYAVACNIGSRYAAAWLLYQRLNPVRGLPLAWIAMEMPSHNDGYSVGFMSHVQQYVAAALRHMHPSDVERNWRDAVKRDTEVVDKYSRSLGAERRKKGGTR